MHSLSNSKIKENVYLYFLIKLLLFSSILFILDFGIGNGLRFFYFKQKSGIEYRTAYSIDSTTADLLIFGSSRANHQYHPYPFENKFNLTYYNVGRDGSSIFYDYAILQGILKRYNPKIVILDFEPDEFTKKQESYDRISCLLPYYINHPELHSIIRLKSPFEKYKLLSKIYPYNSLILLIAAGNSEFYKNMNSDIKGYVPLTKTWMESIKIDSLSTKSTIDNNKVEIFESFIQSCINSKVTLYIVCTPSFIIRKHPYNSIVIGKEIAEKFNISFFDYTNDSMLVNNSSLYADIQHFNDKGARLFTNILVDRLLKDNEVILSTINN